MADNGFTYTKFQIAADGQTVSFGYEILQADERFTLNETLKFPVELPQKPAIMAGLRALHLALGVSYYKIFASQQIIHPYAMSGEEAGFWNDIWHNGLGEYLYVNHISPASLAAFSEQDGVVFTGNVAGTDRRKAILGIGGGKDSVVAGELLQQCGVQVMGFVMATGEQLGQAQAVANTMGITLQVVERSLDKQLLSLQERPDAYKGHIPISLVFGLVGTVLAAATDTAYVVVANEASASIPRISWEYGTVNHQWSKSFGFEQTLQSRIYESIASDITYFSAIRQLTSVAVAKLFARQPQYFEVFTSDNYVFRIDPAKRPNARWSLESPKSLSSFILLAPWLSEDDAQRTFGRNFLDESTLADLFRSLTGIAGEPPLDCVGTVEELVLSLNLLTKQNKYQDSILIQLAKEAGILNQTDSLEQLTTMLQLQADHALPSDLADTITHLLTEQLA